MFIRVLFMRVVFDILVVLACFNVDGVAALRNTIPRYIQSE